MIWAWFFHRAFRDENYPNLSSAPRSAGEGSTGKTVASPSVHGLTAAKTSAPAGELDSLSASEENPLDRPPISWRKLLSSRTVWLLWAQYFCLTYGWFFYVTWLPTYLKESRGQHLDQNALMLWLKNLLGQLLTPETTRRILVAALAGIPLFFGGLGAIVCGLATPRLVRATGSLARTRQTMALLGFTGASVLLVTSCYVSDPLLAVLAMGLASFCNDLTMPGSWSTCMDVGANCAGTLSGSMNMMGSLGAGLAPLVIGIILDSTLRNWTLTFWISGIIYFLGGLCWLWLDPVTPLEDQKA